MTTLTARSGIGCIAVSYTNAVSFSQLGDGDAANQEAPAGQPDEVGNEADDDLLLQTIEERYYISSFFLVKGIHSPHASESSVMRPGHLELW